MNKKNRKKGFTLVELIVVIAIIAILAAVAVPTTMHFVDKANASKEAQEINFSSTLDGMICEVLQAGKETNILSKVENENSVLKGLGNIDKIESCKDVTLTVRSVGDNKYKVDYKITGKKYDDKGGVVTGTASGTFTAEQIFKSKTAPAQLTVTFVAGTDFWKPATPAA